MLAKPLVQFSFNVSTSTENGHQPLRLTKQTPLKRVIFAEAGDGREVGFAFEQQQQRA